MSEKWLIAVSGGPDSMALLNMCLEKGIAVAAAHVNYHHRKEADEEEVYVRSFCAERSIDCYVRNEPFIYKGNFEAEARSWRYSFFVQLVKEHRFQGVMVGHHEDDLIETYLMQKNSKLVPETYGLKEEMLYQGILVRRPLLSYTKQDLISYCHEHQLSYYIDATNLENNLTRNELRHTVVEPMSRVQRDMVLQEIKRKNMVLYERRDRVSAYIHKDQIQLAQYRGLEIEDRLTLLRMFLEHDNRHHTLEYLKEIDGILCRQKDFMIPFGGRCIVQNNESCFVIDPPEAYVYIVENPQQLYGLQSDYFRIEAGEPGVYAVTVSPEDYPLTIRSPLPGDAIRMRYGTKRLNRFFIDRHIPKYQRLTWPVVVNRSGDIILLPGLGCDEIHYSIRPSFSVIQCTLSGGIS